MNVLLACPMVDDVGHMLYVVCLNASNPICGFWPIDDDAYKDLMMFHEIIS